VHSRQFWILVQGLFFFKSHPTETWKTHTFVYIYRFGSCILNPASICHETTKTSLGLVAVHTSTKGSGKQVLLVASGVHHIELITQHLRIILHIVQCAEYFYSCYRGTETPTPRKWGFQQNSSRDFRESCNNRM
jgi:hypothetical protein